jgi:pyridinium-3,5-biscarboxylic acid mononucleotide sulfurtransferase
MNDALQAKYQRLIEMIRPLERVIVAFSAGVDSTVVLKVAMEAVGRENVLAATGVSPSLAQRELQSVRDLAEAIDAPLELVDTSEMDNPSYSSNPINRCYFCKGELFGKLTEVAQKRGYKAILSGVNYDDRGDFRPGMEAAEQWRVRAPLLEAEVTKADVRDLARELGLPNWEKPALACLSSRIPYGTPVTVGSLGQVEKAEGFLWDRGFKNFRVRHHSKLARIEVTVQDLPRLLEEPLRSELLTYYKNIGYTYITMDLQGFRSGSGNEVLKKAGA